MSQTHAGVGGKLSFLDRYLTFWIFLAMAVGVDGSDADRADAFRQTRDQLRRRLAVVFAQDAPGAVGSSIARDPATRWSVRCGVASLTGASAVFGPASKITPISSGWSVQICSLAFFAPSTGASRCL